MQCLEWSVNGGYGFLDIVPRDYDAGYFDKYVGYEKTQIGVAITSGRIAFVAKYHQGEVLDVGIGSGHFVANRPGTFGYDINPKGIEWLKERGKFRDLSEGCAAFSFFDSFEHIKSHDAILREMPAGTKLFISIPIFEDVNHVLKSKHFRPDEHYWYFTGIGLVKYMAERGFHTIGIDNFETRAGREDILSFAFVKGA